ncbi:MAG: ThuA domain-containing protein [bacterium]|nr:ThuA domain-containing protein [bacterium]
MRMPFLLCFAIIAVIVSGGWCAEPLNVAVITGGHDFDSRFWTMFDDNKMITYTRFEHPNANQIYTDGTAKKFDVIVLYDMYGVITEEQKEGFKAFVQSGKGLVALHHSLGSYQQWPDYVEMIGGLYVIDDQTMELGGKKQKPSTYQHDVEIDVKVVNDKHPITRGISDFTLMDEIYGGVYVQDGVHVLLETDTPNSTKQLAWTKTYGKGRVATIQLGHDQHAFQDKSYRTLLARAIQWASGKKTPQPKPIQQVK